MNNDLRTSLVIDLDGNMRRRARQFGRSLNQFSKNGQRDMARLERMTDRFGRTFGGLANKYTGFLSGAALIGAGRMVGKFDDRLTRLGIQANVSDEKMESLKAQILDTANASNVRVDPGQITDAIDAIVEKTGDLAFAEANIKNIGTAIQATDAAGKDIGEILAEFQKMDIKSPDEVLKALDILNVQGKEGAFTLQNLAKLGPRVITAYTAAGRGGTDALREMGAALQMVRQGTGSSEMAATAFEATMRSLTDSKKIKKLKDLADIDVYEKMANGEKVMRPINDLMEEIIKKSDGDISKIGEIFDAEAVRAFNAAAGEFNRTGSLATLDKYYKVQADGTRTQKDAARGARTFSAATRSLMNAWETFSNNNLSEPVSDLADAITSLDSDDVQRWMELAKQIALISGGVYALGKIRRVVSPRMGGGAGAAAGAGGGLGGMTPTPVYVVNGPGMGGRRGGRGARGMRGAGTAGAAAYGAGGKGGRKMGRMAKFGKGLGALGMLAEAGMVGYGIGTLLNEGINMATEKATGRDDASFGTWLARVLHEDEEKKIANQLRGPMDPATVPQVTPEGELKIRVEDDRVSVEKMVSKGMNMETEGAVPVW